jgi:hypothetical protein
MNLINEFALLFVVAAPIAVLIAMNLFLALEGERGTLMFPSGSLEGGGQPPAGEVPANDPAYRSAA